MNFNSVIKEGNKIYNRVSFEAKKKVAGCNLTLTNEINEAAYREAVFKILDNVKNKKLFIGNNANKQWHFETYAGDISLRRQEYLHKRYEGKCVTSARIVIYNKELNKRKFTLMITGFPSSMFYESDCDLTQDALLKGINALKEEALNYLHVHFNKISVHNTWRDHDRAYACQSITQYSCYLDFLEILEHEIQVIQW